MTEQRRVPEPMTRTEFLEVLDDIRNRVALGDSYEGNLSYTMPDVDSEENLAIEFMVMAAWRYGNLQGQGGMRMVGNWLPQPETEARGEPRTPVSIPDFD